MGAYERPMLMGDHEVKTPRQWCIVQVLDLNLSSWHRSETMSDKGESSNRGMATWVIFRSLLVLFGHLFFWVDTF